MRTAFLIAALAMPVLVVAADARDTGGQWDHVDPATREWFRSVKSPNGIPCCDIADGRRTVWRAVPIQRYELQSGSGSGYEVLVDGEWLPVPPEALIRGIRNPTGDSIVWLRPDKIVRCFVMAPEG